MTSAQPYTAEELEQVSQRIMSVPRHKIQIARNDVLRLLATLAEWDAALKRDADYIKHLEMCFNAMVETATSYRTKLFASDAAIDTLERQISMMSQ